MKNTLYLREMGMNDNSILTDVKNHRVRVLENIDILYKGEKYNMFFEFTQGIHRRYRKTNKRTGAPLKKEVEEIILKDGIYINTEYQKPETDKSGGVWFSSWRHSGFESEFYEKHLDFSKQSVLEIVNAYKIGERFTNVCLIETATADIIRKIGGYRELDILEGDHFFEIGDTWNDEHKVVRCNKREWIDIDGTKKFGVTKFCEVDLITGKITG